MSTGSPSCAIAWELRGRLPDLIDEADHTIYEVMRKDAVIRGLVREEVPEYPPVAIREALVNAVGHRSYALDGSAVAVRIYDDAIEIHSPGRLPAHIRLEDLRTAQFSRNPRIMRALCDLGYVEEVGTGINRIYHALEAALLAAPEFEEPGDAFCVRFHNQSVSAAEDRLWTGQFEDPILGPDEKVALVYARRHGAVRNTDVQHARNLSSVQSGGVLRTLVAVGLLEPVGRGRGTRYVLGEGAASGDAVAAPGQRLRVIVQHALRAGAVTNADVRGLLGVDRYEALRLLEDAVFQGLLQATGQRRGYHYVPVARNKTHQDPEGTE